MLSFINAMGVGVIWLYTITTTAIMVKILVELALMTRDRADRQDTGLVVIAFIVFNIASFIGWALLYASYGGFE